MALLVGNIGEPPTLHRLQVLQRFQAAFGVRSCDLMLRSHPARPRNASRV